MADDQQTNLRNRIAAKRAEPAFQAFAKAIEAPVNLEAAWAVFYREAADICDEAGGKYAGRALNEHAAGAFDLMETFLRKANEAEYVATPCDPMVPCEDGGEPCHVHERLMAHAEGDHELCEPDCGPAVPVSSPPPDQTVDRATLLRDFLWRLEQSAGDAAAEKFLDDNPELRRLAAEAQQPDTETRCSHGCDVSRCPCLACEADAAEKAEPTIEQIVRDHVTTLHLIGEQLANVETWMWEHLADVRAASAAADTAPEPGRV